MAKRKRRGRKWRTIEPWERTHKKPGRRKTGTVQSEKVVYEIRRVRMHGHYYLRTTARIDGKVRTWTQVAAKRAGSVTDALKRAARKLGARIRKRFPEPKKHLHYLVKFYGIDKDAVIETEEGEETPALAFELIVELRSMVVVPAKELYVYGVEIWHREELDRGFLELVFPGYASFQRGGKVYWAYEWITDKKGEKWLKGGLPKVITDVWEFRVWEGDDIIEETDGEHDHETKTAKPEPLDRGD